MAGEIASQLKLASPVKIKSGEKKIEYHYQGSEGGHKNRNLFTRFPT